MTTRVAPICGGCIFFLDAIGDEQGLNCTAFPEGIPQAILENRADHRRPFEGDGGVRFRASKPEFAEYADRLFPSK